MISGMVNGRRLSRARREVPVIDAEIVNRHIADISKCLRPVERGALADDLLLFREAGCLTSRVAELFGRIEFLVEADRIMDRQHPALGRAA